jgi:hypothetical protein
MFRLAPRAQRALRAQRGHRALRASDSSPDAPPRPQAAGPALAAAMGRRESRRGAQTRGSKAQSTAPPTGAARAASPRSRHDAGDGGDPLAARRAHFRGPPSSDLGVDASLVSRHSFFGSARSRSPHRRSERRRVSRSRTARAGCSLRQGRQSSGRSNRTGLGEPLPCARVAQPDGDPSRHRLRAAELPEASSRRRIHRSAQLWTVVRRLAEPCRARRARAPHRFAANVARVRRMASSGRRHRYQGATECARWRPWG